MATVSITYAKLETAATQARSVATELTEYADLIPTKVTTPLGDLTGGSTSYTSSAVSLAQQKASQMRERASAYTTFASGIETFSASAQEADAAVASTIRSLTVDYAGNLSFWERLVLAITDLYNKTIGKTGLGTLLTDIRNLFSEAYDLYLGKVEDAWNWFKYGDGQYYLDALVTAAKAYATGLVLLKVVCALATLGPAGVVFVYIAAIIGAVALAKKVIDAGITVGSAFFAAQENDTEPGVANYYGSVGSLSDYFETYSTNADLQNAASDFDTAGSWSNFILGIMGLFTSGSLSEGTLSASGSNVLTNIAKNYLGIKDGSWNPIGNLFGFNADDSTSVVSGISSVLEFFQTSLDIDGLGDLASMFDNASGNYNFSLINQLKKLLGY